MDNAKNSLKQQKLDEVASIIEVSKTNLDEIINDQAQILNNYYNQKDAKQILYDYGIEIGGGLGPFAGKVWRVGLMGHSAYEKNVDKLLNALKILLK